MEMIISHIEGLNVSAKAEKKILNWFNKNLHEQKECYHEAILSDETLFTERQAKDIAYYKGIIFKVKESVEASINDFQKMREVFDMASSKRNVLTRIFVDEYLFKTGLSSVTVADKVYKKLAEVYLEDTFGKDTFQEAKEKEEIEYQERIKKENEERKYKTLKHYLSVAKGYIDFLEANTDYQIREEKNGKFTKYVCFNPATNQYIIAKRNDGYKCFHEIMKYAFQEHEGLILKAANFIKQQ